MRRWGHSRTGLDALTPQGAILAQAALTCGGVFAAGLLVALCAWGWW